MTTWVLLRGLGREARHWGPFVTELQEALGPSARVLPVDLPGTGSARGRRSPWTVGGIADDVLASLRALGAQPPYVWVGMSLGGMVAMAAAARCPEQTAGCAVINTSAAGLSPPWRRLRGTAALCLIATTLFGRTARARERKILALTANSPASERLLQQWETLAQQAPVSHRNLIAQMWAARGFVPPPRSARPCLVLASARDRIVSPQCSLELAQEWKATLAVHPAAGHDIGLDAPGWLIARLLDLSHQLGCC